MVYLSNLGICFALLLLWNGILTASSHDNVTRIAFVFAGGVRSFTLPEIYQSIRYNLFESFCPHEICDYDVFLRFSLSDNTHENAGLDARGAKVEASSTQLKELSLALPRILSSNRGRLFYDIVDIGSVEEAKEMELMPKENPFRHQIYRKYDPRRYSMYFHRWAAYSMALRQEKINGVPYSWVVHTRLDYCWGTPVDPYFIWPLDKMYVHDSWTADVPDTFAFLPRQRADIYFSLDAMVSPEKVLCLGGPNFDPRTVSTQRLEVEGYTASEIIAIQSELCLEKFRGKSHIYKRPKFNDTWSHSGMSEDQLKRKLEYYGMSLVHGTIGFVPFFAFLVRRREAYNFGLCFKVDPELLIGYLWRYQRATASIATGCYAMDFDIRHGATGFNCPYDADITRRALSRIWRTDSPFLPPGAPRARTLPQWIAPEILVGGTGFGWTKPVFGGMKEPCALGKDVTGFDFMPFRVKRRGDVCLSVNFTATTPPEPRLSLQSCALISLANLRVSGIVTDLDRHQMFAFHPGYTRPQHVRFFSLETGTRCLTVGAVDSPQSPSANITIPPASSSFGLASSLLSLTKCSFPDYSAKQLFYVQEVVRKSSKNFDRTNTAASSSQPLDSKAPSNLVDDRNNALLSKKRDKNFRLAVFRWAGDTDKNGAVLPLSQQSQCVTVATNSSSYYSTQGQSLTLGPCHSGPSMATRLQYKTAGRKVGGSLIGDAFGGEFGVLKNGQPEFVHAKTTSRSAVFVLDRTRIESPPFRRRPLISGSARPIDRRLGQ